MTFFLKPILLAAIMVLTIHSQGFDRIVEDKKLIKEIRIIGNELVSREAILASLSVREGEEVTTRQLRGVLRNLHNLRFFDDIKIRLEDVSEKEIILIIELKERKRVANVIFVGNDNLDRSKILEDNPIDELKFINNNEINKGRFRIINTYLDEGFLDVWVKTEILASDEKDENNENLLDLYYLIEEGSRYYVKDINFNLPENISTDLRARMQLKKDEWYGPGYFNFRNLQSDRRLITVYLQSLGFFRAEIENIDFEYKWRDSLKKNKKDVTVDIKIKTGEKYKFGKTVLRGNNIFTDRELLSDIKRREGSIYNEIFHQQDIQSIYEKYRNNGYIFSRVTPIEEVNEDSLTIDYVFDIYEGRIGHIENINIEGLGKTKPNVVERELLFEEGEVFNLDKILNSIRNLTRLDYFSSVEPNYQVGSTEGLMDIYFALQEKQTTVLSAGISFSFNSGFSLTASINDNNFLGYGYTFGFSTSIGFDIKDFSISFVDPWFLNLPVALGTSLRIGKYYQDFGISAEARAEGRRIQTPSGDTAVSVASRGLVNLENDSVQYTTDIITYSIFSSQRFLNWFQVRESISVNYVDRYLQNFKVWPEVFSQQELYEANRDLFTQAPPDGEKDLYYIFGLSLQRDNRDSVINPTDGEIISLATRFFFGDFSLTEWELNFGFYRSLQWNFSGLPEFRMGLTFAYRNNLKTFGNPIVGNFIYDELDYFLILETEVRGWERGDLTDYRRERYGSEALFTTNLYPYGQSVFWQNLEVRQDLLVDFVQAVLFFDMGAISREKLSFNDFSSWNYIFDWQNYVYSTGVGFRINLPQFPIRFYFSWKFIYDQNQKNFRAFNQRLDDNIYVPDFIFDIQGLF